ncbi:glutathione S-transferase [Melanogaster broomeanus]|nr:glutathione S-transferase [Melanogaster broomeanus]
MTDTGKRYHNECTGEALETVRRHTADQDITLFAGCFCPFVQRVWVTLEYLGIPYKYCLVPALRLNNYSPPKALNESTVIMDFLEDLATTSTKRSLFPPVSDPYARALVRLQSDHINRSFVPTFYRYLQAQDPSAQIAAGNEFMDAIETLVELFERAEREVGGTGLWKEGGELGWADIMVAPWIFRATNVLKHYRGFEVPEGQKFRGWLTRLFEHPAFRSTCSTEELYLDSYERYAFNRPNTSQVANAINSGRGLP